MTLDKNQILSRIEKRVDLYNAAATDAQKLAMMMVLIKEMDDAMKEFDNIANVTLEKIDKAIG